MKLVLLRSVAFCLDLAVLLFLIIWVSAFAAIVLAFRGVTPPLRDFLASDLLLPVFLVIGFAARDAYSSSRLPTAARLFNLRVSYPGKNNIGRFLLSLLRSVLFFGTPVIFIMTVVPIDHVSESSMLRQLVWQSFFGAIVLPISILLNPNGRGLHDLLTGCSVCIGSVSDVPASGNRWWRRALGIVILASTLSGALTYAIALSSPRFFGMVASFLAFRGAKETAISTLDYGQRDFADFRLIEHGLNFRLEKGGATVAALLSQGGVPREVVARVENQVFEWAVLLKSVGASGISLRDDLRIAPGATILDVRIWITGEISEDFQFAPGIAEVLGAALLELNNGASAAEIAFQRGARVGPVKAVEMRSILVVKLDNKGRVALFFPSEKPIKRILDFWLALPSYKGTYPPYLLSWL